MKFKKPPRRESSENIIPLINIVFLLLIFFMITARISAQDPFAIQPPASTDAAEQERTDDNMLYLSLSGELAYRGEIVTKAGLIPRLDSSHFGREGTVLMIKADAQMPMPLLMALLDQLQQADINNIELLAISN